MKVPSYLRPISWFNILYDPLVASIYWPEDGWKWKRRTIRDIHFYIIIHHLLEAVLPRSEPKGSDWDASFTSITYDIFLLARHETSGQKER